MRKIKNKINLQINTLGEECIILYKVDVTTWVKVCIRNLILIETKEIVKYFIKFNLIIVSTYGDERFGFDGLPNRVNGDIPSRGSHT